MDLSRLGGPPDDLSHGLALPQRVSRPNLRPARSRLPESRGSPNASAAALSGTSGSVVIQRVGGSGVGRDDDGRNGGDAVHQYLAAGDVRGEPLIWGKKRPKCPDSARMGALDGFSAQFVRSKAVCLLGTTVPCRRCDLRRIRAPWYTSIRQFGFPTLKDEVTKWQKAP